MADNAEASGSRAGRDPEPVVAEENSQWLEMLAAGDPEQIMEADDENENETHDEMEDPYLQDGNETTTGVEGTSGSSATKKRKARRRNKLGTTREEITEVDPTSGTPLAPYELARTFGNQIGCIIRTFGKVNAEAHQSKENITLAILLVEKLHNGTSCDATQLSAGAPPLRLRPRPRDSVSAHSFASKFLPSPLFSAMDVLRALREFFHNFSDELLGSGINHTALQLLVLRLSS